MGWGGKKVRQQLDSFDRFVTITMPGVINSERNKYLEIEVEQQHTGRDDDVPVRFCWG